MARVTIRAFLLYILGCLKKLITFVYYGFNQEHIQYTDYEVKIVNSCNTRIRSFCMYSVYLSYIREEGY